MPNPNLSVFSQKRQDAVSTSGLLKLGHRVILWHAPRMERFFSQQTLDLFDLKLRRAGRPGDFLAPEFLAVSQIAACTLGSIGFAYGGLLFGIFGIFFGLLGILIGYFTPILVLNEWMNTRMTLMILRLPYAVDVMALCLSAGSTFIGAVEELVKDSRDHPLDEEFRIFLSELQLGKTRREALLNLTQRCGIDLLDNVVLSVIQGEEQGVPISEVLKREAAHIRKVRIEQADEQANKASTKILFPTMIIVVATLLLLFGSFIIKIFRGTVFSVA